MIPVDFHTHTLFSNCGIHTHIEMLRHGRELGMAGIVFTDHGSEVGGRIPSCFFERLTDPVPGIRLLKGIEANLCDLSGHIDVPVAMLPHIDLVLLGFHGNIPNHHGREVYTEAMIAAIEQNPWVDVLSHLHPSVHGVDLAKVVRVASRHGVVVELNNSKLLLQKAGPDQVADLLRICREADCRIAIGSDAHALNELGCDEQARAILRRVDFPEELWVNRTASRAFAFIEQRRSGKSRLPAPAVVNEKNNQEGQ